MKVSVVMLLWRAVSLVQTLECRALIEDEDIQQIDWPNLHQCLKVYSGISLPRNASVNIWRLVKMCFDGTENIPPEVYLKLHSALLAIPNDELRNVSMAQVEVVEAFGAVRNTENSQGFNVQQLHWIAEKVRKEWLAKTPLTYSQYDLISMGEILCHLPVGDIAKIHADAFREAAEWIGNIEICPEPQLKALAQLATHHDAFGPTHQWSKLDVSIIGNIINGLPQECVIALKEEKLELNRFYAKHLKEETSNGQKFPANDTVSRNKIVESD